MKLIGILVANNTHARFFTTDKPSSTLTEIHDMVHMEGRLHDRDLISDSPGRIKSSDGVGHAFEQATDPKKHESEAFAKRIADYLLSAHNAHQYEQLVIVAGPSFLGLLRSQLPDQIKKLVCFELDKNVTSLSSAEIRSHLPSFFPPIN